MTSNNVSSVKRSILINSKALIKSSDLWLKIVIALVSPLLLIGVLEGIAFLWERMQANSLYAWEMVASRRLVWESYYGPDGGYTLMKRSKYYEWQGIPVSINSHGLRGPETPYEKPPATYRILNLGDSVVMGWGVREEYTYGRRLESLLNEQSTGNLRFEVINAGVPGWNLENALAYLQAEGLKYEPDLVLLELTIANDIRGKTALLADNQPAATKWMRSNTYFWPFLTVQLRWLQARAEGLERIGVINPPTDPEEYFPMDVQAENWTNVWDIVLAINQLAEKHGAQFGLIIFPLEFQVLDVNYPTLPQELFMEKALEDEIQALDLLPALREACLEKPGGACRLEDRYLFADVWMHPSAIGHQVTADEIMTEFEGLFPK